MNHYDLRRNGKHLAIIYGDTPIDAFNNYARERSAWDMETYLSFYARNKSVDYWDIKKIALPDEGEQLA